MTARPRTQVVVDVAVDGTTLNTFLVFFFRRCTQGRRRRERGGRRRRRREPGKKEKRNDRSSPNQIKSGEHKGSKRKGQRKARFVFTRRTATRRRAGISTRARDMPYAGRPTCSTVIGLLDTVPRRRLSCPRNVIRPWTLSSRVRVCCWTRRSLTELRSQFPLSLSLPACRSGNRIWPT